MKSSPIFPDSFFPVVLVGLPGAGKTTVSRELARLLGVVEVDTDAEIKRRTRQTIPQVFASRGESGFRKIEHQAVRHSLKLSRGVISLGGGAILHPSTRELLHNHTVVYLRTSVAEAARRVGSGQTRPLLSGSDNPVEEIQELALRRIPLYEEVCDITVSTDGLTPQEVAVRVFEALRKLLTRGFSKRGHSGAGMITRRIHIEAEHPYDVVVGRGILDEVSFALRSTSRRVLLLYAPPLGEAAESLRARLSKSVDVFTLELPDGEDAKTLHSVQRCWNFLGENRFSRTDTVIALGGGATTDLGGFVAATWLRGVDVIQVPTTVLGMVDAAVGGKTGINTEAGKNLVGSFHSPVAVVCDLDFLKTLPLPQRTAGLAEIVKCGFISNPDILELVNSGPADVLLGEQNEVLRQIMERAIGVKARVVSADLRESGRREILNYGHTFAHAVEKCEDYHFGHGFAVSVGMVFAAEVACEMGLCERSFVDYHRRLLSCFNLPIHYDQASPEVLVEAMRADKKVRANHIRMVLVSAPGQVQVKAISDIDLLLTCAQRVRNP